MSLSNWLGIALMAVILIVGISLYLYYRHKFRNLEGFEGIITERGKPLRRIDPNWIADLKHLEELAKKR